MVGTPAVGGGRVFVGSDNGNMYCLDQVTGSLIWEYKIGEQQWGGEKKKEKRGGRK